MRYRHSIRLYPTLFYYIAVVLTIAVSIGFVGCSRGYTDEVLYHDGELVESLHKADSILSTGDIDKAVALYHSISVKSQYIAKDDKENALAALSAALAESQIHFNRSNYGGNLEALLRARNIAVGFGLSQKEVKFLMGVLYITIGSQNHIDSYINKGAECFADVIEHGNPSDLSIYEYSATNLIVYSNLGDVRRISSNPLKKYFHHGTNDNKEYEMNVGLDSVMNSIRRKDYSTALRVMERLKKSPQLPVNRVIPAIYFISGEIYMKDGQYAEALTFFKESEKLVDPDNGKDMELQVYEALKNCYLALNDKIKSDIYSDKVNNLRREITSFALISTIKQAEFGDSMRRTEDNLKLEQQKSRLLVNWVIGGAVVTAILALIMSLLFFFIRRINEKNKMLYHRYVQLLRSNRYVHPDGRKEMQAVTHTSSAETSYSHHHQEMPTEMFYAEQIEKIERVLDSPSSLFSSDFSATMMSVQTAIKPRLLTTIISEHYHTNFRNLINSRRIRAVCHSLESTDAYDNLTVDAIADSVGIKSRATFSSAFKKETGMTPAQYIRFSKERKTGKG